MGTLITGGVRGGGLRWLAPLDKTNPQTSIKDVTVDSTGGTAIERSDVFLVNGQARCKYYSSERFIDLLSSSSLPPTRDAEVITSPSVPRKSLSYGRINVSLGFVRCWLLQGMYMKSLEVDRLWGRSTAGAQLTGSERYQPPLTFARELAPSNDPPSIRAPAISGPVKENELERAVSSGFLEQWVSLREPRGRLSQRAVHPGERSPIWQWLCNWNGYWRAFSKHTSRPPGDG
ncbi:hypothetical protein HOY80DRAFT_1072507 [Tuber brumale]|nr:hypothetical protein HOY80DRAFT_1072507 [Tuber brumale]